MSEELKQVAEGGIWTDSNLDESLDWAGDTGSAAAAENETATHTPKTARQIEREILADAAISDQVLNIITNRVTEQFKAHQFSTIVAEFEKMTLSMDEHKRIVEEWMNAQYTRQKESEVRQNQSATNDIRRLEEQIAMLENKITELFRITTTRGAEEITLIHEAHKIIKDRQAVEESEIASEPSIIGRMNARVQSLNESLRAIEPVTEKAFATDAIHPVSNRNVKKKIGRM